MKKYTIIILAILFITSCDSIKCVKSKEIKCYGNDPLYHTAYVGSDSKFHYFVYSKGKVSGKWKVRKEDLKWIYGFPYEEKRHLLITRDKTGKLRPIIIKKSQNESASPNSDSAAAKPE
jgi:hypothetical protein